MSVAARLDLAAPFALAGDLLFEFRDCYYMLALSGFQFSVE
jgi:hypothetical protein